MSDRRRPTTGDPAGDESIDRDWLLVRLWLLGSAALPGVAVGLVGAGALALLGGDPVDGSDTLFAVGTVVLGFGTLGWSGSSLLARGGGAALVGQLGLSSDWTEARSRRAMTRLVGLGAGVMLGAVAVGLPFY